VAELAAKHIEVKRNNKIKVMEMENFNTFKDFKDYVGIRPTIRINCCGLTNTRITRIRFQQLKGFIKQIKGFIKQINNGNSSPKLTEQLLILEKESQFRQMCLNLKSVFSIEIR
jgi:hypothetical protein